MRTLLMAVALAATATVWSQHASAAARVSADTPAPGDIPDTQAFVTFAGRGYTVLVPEGWARTQRGSAVTFRSNANSELIDIGRAGVHEDLRARFHPVGVIRLKSRSTLGTEPASLFMFRSRSEPNPVTGKSAELENELYTSSRHALRATLLLSGPVGADNADQWKKIARSFRWK
ncbi:MAG: hypothetical protein M3154_09755 [Candidatus Eremiobacteraeota bacterium]|nr:hypothetical protein [Candidatus Eremiobacteraeota bacterium]